MNYTPAQRGAIEHEEGNLLVSASAGSGKTRTMVNRILRLIAEKKVDVSEILAITFTKKAAQELKDRLVAALGNRMETADEEEMKWLAEQLRKIPLASVGTIDSFCNDTLKKYYFAADLDPAFEVLSQSEADAIKEEAIDAVFAKEYADESEEFLRLVRFFAESRNDSGLKKAVLSIAAFTEAEASAEEFFQKAEDAYSPDGQNKDRSFLLETFIGYCRAAKADFEEAKNIGEMAGYDSEALNILSSWIEAMRKICEARDPEELLAAYSEWDSGHKLTKTKDDEAQAAWVDLWKKKIKKKLTDIWDVFLPFFADQEQKVGDGSKNVLSDLLSLTRKFMEKYAEEKRRAGKLDFPDLGHKTLDLLRENEDVRNAVASSYRYIFVDEYQDVNDVQEAIVQSIARNNLFFVGDVKQSIYGFRGCNPGLFLQKIQDARGENAAYALYELSENFRSAKGVIEGVNGVFDRIMTKETEGIDYQEEKLVYGGKLEEDPGQAAFVFYEKTEASPEISGVYSVREAFQNEVFEEDAEGVRLAELIEDVVGKDVYDSDKKEMRPATFGDIAVLFRSGNKVVTSAVEILKRRNIPVISQQKESVWDSSDVKTLVSFLKLLENGEEDADLAAALLSPVGGLTESDLVEIRSKGKELVFEPHAPFFRVAEAYAERDPEKITNIFEKKIVEKLRDFYAFLKETRQKAAFLPVRELMAEVFAARGLKAEILKKRLGRRRMLRINRLLAEAGGDRPLFLSEFLKKVRAESGDVAVVEGGSENAVRFMTMHAAKGLEFPVVILIGLGVQYNRQDAKGTVLQSREAGLSPWYYDEETMQKRCGLHRAVVREAINRASAREEIRVLYVALTRAKSKLFLLAQKGKIAEQTSRLSLLKASKPADFFSLEMFPEYKPQGKAHGESVLRDIALENRSEEAERIRAAREFVYPFPADVEAPKKQTVTQILKEQNDKKRGDGSEKSVERWQEDKERAMLGEGTKREKGIRLHAFLQEHDFTVCDEAGVRAAMENARNGGVLEKGDEDSAPVIAKILSSDLFRSFATCRVFREKEFTYKTQAGTIVQGVLDLLAIGETLTVVDYKYSQKSDEDLKKTYAPQVDLYAEAAEKFYGIKTGKKVIINLANAQIILL